MVKCVLCGEEIEKNALSGWDQGNNAWPLADGRCCDPCDAKVIAERIRLIQESKNGN